jgi:hypothetical protein
MVAGTGAVIAGAAVVSDGNASEADGGASSRSSQSSPNCSRVSDTGGIQLTAVTPVHDARAVEPFIDLGGL